MFCLVRQIWTTQQPLFLWFFKTMAGWTCELPIVSENQKQQKTTNTVFLDFLYLTNQTKQTTLVIIIFFGSAALGS